MSEYLTQPILQATEELDWLRVSEGRRLNAELTPYHEVSLKEFLEKLKDYRTDNVKHKVMIGFLGEMSSGKSTLINMMIACPLLPMASVVTSSCPVEFCYGKAFCLQVFTYPETSEEGETKEDVVYTYEAEKPLSDAQLQALKAFASHCLKTSALLPENLNYFFDTEQMRTSDGAFEMDERDPRQVGQLLLLALNGYVGQNTTHLTKENERLVQERNELMASIFHLDPNSAYGVRIRLNCELLRNGVILVDLPGLGSDVAPHAGITTAYLRRADCCVLVFGADGKTGAQNKALSVMEEFEMMKSAGRDSRFLAVINKCDRLLGKQNFSSQLAQTVNRIKPQITAVKIDQIIPVSAYYADIRMVEQGFPLERTIRWPEAQMFGMSITDYQEKMKRDYHRVFCYTDPVTGQEIASSTAQFIEDTIGAYTARICFLNAMREVKSLSESCGISLGQLQVQAEMIRLLQEFGDTLMRELLSKMEEALKKAQSKFTEELDHAREIIQNQQARLGDDFKQANDRYVAGLTQADQVMHHQLEVSTSLMTTNFAGCYLLTIPENYEIYRQLTTYFKTFDFDPYLAEGTNLLKAALDKQRASYVANSDAFRKCFLRLQADCNQDLIQAYHEFEQRSEVQQAPPDVRELYAHCYQAAKTAILSQVEQIANQMISEIDQDTRVETQINTTLSRMQNLFHNFISYYHSDCVSYLQFKIGTTFFLDRPFLDVRRIRKELGRPFISDENRQSFPEKLSELLLGQEDGHTVRMQDVVKEVTDDFSSRVVRKYKEFFPVITTSTRNLFGLAKPKITAEFLRIGNIAGSMRESLERLRDAESFQQAVCLSSGPYREWAEVSCQEMLEAVERQIRQMKQLETAMRKRASVAQAPETPETPAQFTKAGEES